MNLARVRNQLLISITRSKAWVRVIGYGDQMKKLQEEFECLRSQRFELEFEYPSPEEIKQLRVVHRDVQDDEIQMIRDSDDDLSKIVRYIESGKIHVSDLDETVVDRMKEILQ